MYSNDIYIYSCKLYQYVKDIFSYLKKFKYFLRYFKFTLIFKNCLAKKWYSTAKMFKDNFTQFTQVYDTCF